MTNTDRFFIALHESTDETVRIVGNEREIVQRLGIEKVAVLLGSVVYDELSDAQKVIQELMERNPGAALKPVRTGEV